MRPRRIESTRVDDAPVVVRSAKPIAGHAIPAPPEADRARCRRCDCVTTWRPIRGGSLRCDGCGNVFPCRGGCQHLDCAAERQR